MRYVNGPHFDPMRSANSVLVPTDRKRRVLVAVDLVRGTTQR